MYIFKNNCYYIYIVEVIENINLNSISKQHFK